MRMRVSSWFLVVCCTVGLISGVTTQADAGIIPWLYDAVFGPNYASYGGGYSAGYAPSYGGYSASYGGYASGYSYGNMGYGNCGTSACGSGSCAPTSAYYGYGSCASSCSPCGPSSCPGGNCDAGSQSTYRSPASKATGKVPTPVETTPRTYAEPPVESTAPPADGGGFDQPTDGSGFEPPIDDGFRSREERPDASSDPTNIDAFRMPGSVIPQRKPAPMEPDVPETENAPGDPAEGGESDTNTVEPTGTSRLPILRFNLDEKITWHVMPRRSRLPIRASFSNPRVVRQKVKINSGWTPVPTQDASETTRLVKK